MGLFDNVFRISVKFLYFWAYSDGVNVNLNKFSFGTDHTYSTQVDWSQILNLVRSILNLVNRSTSSPSAKFSTSTGTVLTRVLSLQLYRTSYFDY